MKIRQIFIQPINRQLFGTSQLVMMLGSQHYVVPEE